MNKTDFSSVAVLGAAAALVIVAVGAGRLVWQQREARSGARGTSAEDVLPGGGGPGALLTEARFDELFPHRNALFTWQGFLSAAARFPLFVSEGTRAQRLRELAAFLANAAHETTGGWADAPGGPSAWGLHFAEESGCGPGACTAYCDRTKASWPCAAGKTYQGRGPMQLSWNTNYGQAGAALGHELLAHPELVATEPQIAWETAIWFWMTAQAPKPSAHAVMTGGFTPSAQDQAAGRTPGFGLTIDLINGGLECGRPTTAQVTDRVAFYQRFTQVLGVDPGPALTCESMKPY